MEAQNGDHARNIGRAYQNQAIELIYICQRISRDHPPTLAREDAELKRILRVCDFALQSAADSGKDVADEASQRFEEATQLLSIYSKRFYPDDDFVEATMERAKRKDSAQRACSYQSFEDEWKSTTSATFVVLQSPVADLHDPANIIVRQVLSAGPSIPEFLWNFSCYRDRTRIALEQNPHFYSNLPWKESEFTPGFSRSPIEGIWADRELPETIYVLVDRPGRVFLETKPANRSFGNVWRLNGVMIFKDSSGMLEGEQLVNSSSISSIQSNWWHYEEPVVSLGSELIARPSHSCLRPITTSPTAGRTSGFPLEDWTILSRPVFHSVHIHIYTPPAPLPLNVLEPPLPPPTSERPEYCVLYTSIDTLCDDILLSICNFCRLYDENNWNARRLMWWKLTRVCRRWRHLVHNSASYLGLRILCTNGTPTVDTLDHLPALPLIIDYQDGPATMGAPDESGMSHALQQRDRIHHIQLYTLPSSLRKSFKHMDKSFPILEHLSLSSRAEDDTYLVLPMTFLAPNLRHLTLVGVSLTKELPLLASTVSLVTLTITKIQVSGYFLPSRLVTRLQNFPQLEELSISFSIPIPRPSAERELFVALETPVTLSALKRLTFHGISAYLESLVAQIIAPHLEQLRIILFNQVAFTSPHLFNFASAAGILRFPYATVTFYQNAASIVMDNPLWQEQGGDMPKSFSIQVLCRQFDWQIDSVAQICRALGPLLFAVDLLNLIYDGWRTLVEWKDGAVDGATWHELLRPFVTVRKLHISHALVDELSRALQVDDVGLDPELLPGLMELAPELEADNAFASFIVTRQSVDRPVRLSPMRIGWRCSLCQKVFARRQDRDRHELAHLPPFLHCPVPDCTWRGNRADSFRKHWHQKDHQEQYGHTPERSQIETFNPKAILDQVRSGAISFTEGQVQALLLVQVKARELAKSDMWTNPWGRR